MSGGTGSLRSIWAWPLLLAGITLFGLLAALLGQDGAWLWLAWASLSLPLATILLCVLRRDGPPPPAAAGTRRR